MMRGIGAAGTPRCAPPAVVSRLVTRLGRFVLLASMGGLVAGCSPNSILGSDKLPPDITDPAITKTPQGALAAYYGLRDQFRYAFGAGFGPLPRSSVVAIGGLLGDELQTGHDVLPVDARAIGDFNYPTTLDAYDRLQRVRGQASQAIGLLRRYAPEQRALIGHAYVLQAYAEEFLAELFCSGIPLSTLDFDGDYTLRPGSSTDEVYAHALALLDTALTLVGDSTRFVNLARMAQARAHLDLGELAEAAAAAASVPDGYEYSVSFVAGDSLMRSFAFLNWTAGSTTGWTVSVSDREGMNGLDYRSSGDPRTSATRIYTNDYGWGIYHPDKYATDGSSPIVVASGVEARLIEAEAKLAQGDAGWLAMLNALRTDGTYSTRPNAADSTRTDTLWNAGTGGVARLAPLGDPGTPDARIDLLFRERAFWLFLTGHREADMRRLVRYYGRPEDQVYPTGAYPSDGESYGSDVTIPIPPEERTTNPLFTGCISHDA